MTNRCTCLLAIVLVAGGCKGKGSPSDAGDVPDETTDVDAVDDTPGEDTSADGDAVDAPAPVTSALLVDLDLLHHSAWLDLKAAMDEASIALDYRRFFPHVTRADLDAYQMIVVAAGTAPGYAAAQMSIEERDELRDFVTSGGVLVLLFQPTRMDSYTGENDWYLMNLVLEDLESGMRVEKGSLLGPTFGDTEPHLDDDTGYATLLEFQLGYPWADTNEEVVPSSVETPLPGGRATVMRIGSPDVSVLLTARRGATVWARSGVGGTWTVPDRRPIAAVERIGDGHVAVLPRFLVTHTGAGGQISEHPAHSTSTMERTGPFITWLVDHLRGLHDGDVDLLPSNPALGEDELFCVGAPGFPPRCPGISVTVAAVISTATVAGSPPDGDLAEEFVTSDPADPPPAVPLFAAAKGRIGYGGMWWNDAEADTVFSEASTLGLDALIGTFTPERLTTGELSSTEADDVRTRMADLADIAEARGARWLVGSYYTGHVVNRDLSAFPESVGAQGQEFETPSLLHEPLWDDFLIPAAVEVATVSAAHPGIAGLELDMEMYGTVLTYTDAQAFDDDTFSVYLDSLTDTDLRTALEAVALRGRLDALIERGLLGDYFTALHDKAAEIGARYRAAVHAVDPDFVFTLYFPGYPTAWQYRGLISGLSTPSNPVILVTYDPWSLPIRANQVAGGTMLVHLGGPILGHFPPADLTPVLENCTLYTDGFWYFSHDDISANRTDDPEHGTRAEYRDAVAAAGS